MGSQWIRASAKCLQVCMCAARVCELLAGSPECNRSWLLVPAGGGAQRAGPPVSAGSEAAWLLFFESRPPALCVCVYMPRRPGEGGYDARLGVGSAQPRPLSRQCGIAARCVTYRPQCYIKGTW